MAGNGLPPNPNAVRRNTRVGLTTLPAAGFTGRIPKWPLPENPKLAVRIRLIQDEVELLEERELDDGLSRTERTKLTRTRERLAIAVAERDAILENEKDLWRRLWRTPQAAQWAKNRWDREVAQYVRHKSAAEIGSLEDSKEARLRADALGLTPKGMRSLLWTIQADEVTEKREQKQAATGTDGKPPTRRRLKAVDPNMA
jgi:hypothetical protein